MIGTVLLLLKPKFIPIDLKNLSLSGGRGEFNLIGTVLLLPNFKRKFIPIDLKKLSSPRGRGEFNLIGTVLLIQKREIYPHEFFNLSTVSLKRVKCSLLWELQKLGLIFGKPPHLWAFW